MCLPQAACARFWWRAWDLALRALRRLRRRPRRLWLASAGCPSATTRGFAIEFQDDTIAVFYLLEIVNASGAPVAPASPLVIMLPAEAAGAALLDGASPLASVSGSRVSVAGPLPAGVTSVPVAFRIESWGPRHEFVQAFPLPLDQVALGVQRLSGLTIESAHASSVREASLGGNAFFIASGPGLPAGTPLRLELAGLPHKSPLPLYTALGSSHVDRRRWRVARHDQEDEPRRRTSSAGGTARTWTGGAGGARRRPSGRSGVRSGLRGTPIPPAR